MVSLVTVNVLHLVFYTEEFRHSAYTLLKDTLIPLLLKHEITIPVQLTTLFCMIKRNNIAKAVASTAM